MLFNSIEFLLFFPIVTMIYFFLPQTWRWGWLLFASCVFYMAFIPAYIFILLITITIDYWAARWISTASGKAKKRYLLISIIATCMVLFVFKYYNFFINSVATVAQLLHWNYPYTTLAIILPIGLSFHTFQSLSYVIEVYRGTQKPEKHFGIYALYVMFYPQLVAGPIERPQNLLHQFYEKHLFDYTRVASGLKLMAWGLFKKVVIADRLAGMVDQVYSNPSSFSGPEVVLATIFFSIQIYCDFSGYSDIARGSARVMGFNIMQNFRIPYLAKSVSEFWRRWHISLSTWFRDYVYIPLGGSRVPYWNWQLNLFITFLISGLWHGANWNYVIWGALHGCLLIIENIGKVFIKKVNLSVAFFETKLGTVLRICSTYCVVTLSWIFFRSKSMSEVYAVFSAIFRPWTDLNGVVSMMNTITKVTVTQTEACITFGMLLVLILVDWVQEKHQITMLFQRKPLWFRWACYYSIVLFIILFGITENNQFIYFQF